MGGEKIGVWLPSPMGDAILATPALRAIRKGFGDAHIYFISNGTVRQVLASGGFNNEWIEIDGNVFKNGMKLRSHRLDQVILFKNSFSAGLAALLSGAHRRIGYARDGRSWLLTHRIMPRRDSSGGFEPISMVDYYLTIASEVGCAAQDKTLELTVHEQDVLSMSGKLPQLVAGEGPTVILVPGGSFGPSKLWPVARFGELANRLINECGATVAVSIAPNKAEKKLAAQMCATNRRLINLCDYRLPLGELKAVFGAADLVITNDTGPRHLAAALGCKVVSLFGPNDPRWTRTGYGGEIQVVGQAECVPCDKPRCSQDRHICMESITVEMVWTAARKFLKADQS